jgi:replication-associated recombination protein RarA
MIPGTKNGLPAMATVSAMQKAIRRGMEQQAMEFAVELMHTSKAFHSMVCNRLEIICREDLDTLAAPWVAPFVFTATAQSKERYARSIGEARLMVGNAIRMMCASPKSRAGCHFAAARQQRDRDHDDDQRDEERGQCGSGGLRASAINLRIVP